MSLVDEIIAELEEDPVLFNQIDRVADLAAVTDRPHATPAAFVFIADEIGAENEHATGPVLQRLEGDVSIVIVTENHTDDRMGAAAADIDILIASLRSRLVGFDAPSSEEPLEFVSGELTRARNSVVWWEETYSFVRYLEGRSA